MREKVFKGQQENRSSIADAPTSLLPRMNYRMLASQSQNATNNGKNMFPTDLNLSEVQTSRTVHPVSSTELSTSAPPLTHEASLRNNTEKVSLYKQPGTKKFQENGLCCDKELFDLFQKYYGKLSRCDDIDHILQCLEELLNCQDVIRKLRFNSFQLWLYNSTKDCYEASNNYSQTSYKNRTSNKVVELSCTTVLSILQNLTKGTSVVCSAEIFPKKMFRKVVAMLLADLVTVVAESDNDSSDSNEEESPTFQWDETANWENVRCIELSSIYRGRDLGGEKNEIPVGFLLLGEWTGEKWMRMTKDKYTVPTTNPVEVSLNLGRPSQNRSINIESPSECRVALQSLLSQQLGLSVGSRLMELTLKENYQHAVETSTAHALAERVQNTLRDVEKMCQKISLPDMSSTAQVPDMTILNKLSHNVAAAGVTALGLKTSWMVLNTSCLQSDKNAHCLEYNIFFGNNKGRGHYHSPKTVSEMFSVHNVEPDCVRIGESTSRWERRDFTEIDYGDNPLTKIVEGQVVDDKTPRMSVFDVSLDHLERSGLMSVEECHEWEKENIIKHEATKSRSRPSIKLLAIPFHFLPSHIVEKKKEQLPLQFNSALIMTLHSFDPNDEIGELLLSSSFDMSAFCGSQGDLMVNCFLECLTNIQRVHNKGIVDHLNGLSLSIWEHYSLNKRSSPIEGVHNDRPRDHDSVPLSGIFSLSQAVAGLYTLLTGQLKDSACQILLSKNIKNLMKGVKSGRDSDQYSFLAVRCHTNISTSDIKEVTIDEFGQSEFDTDNDNTNWIKTLQNGKPVIVASASYLQKSHHGRILAQFAGDIDNTAKSYALLPIFAHGSTSILFIPNISFDMSREHQDYNEVSENALDALLCPSPSQLVKLLMSSNLLKTISLLLDNLCAEEKLLTDVRSKTALIDKLNAHIFDAQAKDEQNAGLHLLCKYFSRWRLSYELRKNKANLVDASSQTACAPEIRIETLCASVQRIIGYSSMRIDDRNTKSSPLLHDYLIDQGDKSLDCFLTDVRHNLEELFPDDVIILSLLSKSSASRSSLEDSSKHLALSSISPVRKSEISSRIYSHTLKIQGKVREIFPPVEIRVIRSSLQFSAFDSWEEETLKLFCLCVGIKSSVMLPDSYEITPLQDVHSAEAQTDPLPPPKPIVSFLQKTLPLLFSAENLTNKNFDSMQSSFDITGISETLVGWVKEMCNAEVVLLRVKPKQNITDLQFSKCENSINLPLKEILISSEDCQKSELEGDDNAFIGAVQPVSDQSNSDLVLRLPFIDGELRLLGSGNKNECGVHCFSQQDREVAILVSYLLSCSIMIDRGHHIEKLKSMQYYSQKLDADKKNIELTELSRSNQVIADDYRLQLQVALKAMEMQVQLLSSADVQSISEVILSHCQSMSSLWQDFGVLKSVTLLIRMNNDNFEVFTPVSTSDSHIVDKYSLSELQSCPQVLSTSVLTSQKNLSDKSLEICNKRVMMLGSDSVGAILFTFETPLPRDFAQGHHKEPIVTIDLVYNVLRSTVSAVIDILELPNVVRACESKRDQIIHLQEKNEQLTEELGNALDQSSALEKDIQYIKTERDDFINQLQDKIASCTADVSQKEEMMVKFREKQEATVNHYEHDINNLKNEINLAIQLEKSASRGIRLVENLMVDFAVDMRFEGPQLLSWMLETVDSNDAYVELIRKDTAGNLFMHKGGDSPATSSGTINRNSTSAVNPSVIFSCAKDCIRDSTCKEIVARLDHSQRSKDSHNRIQEDHVTILCIPNRSRNMLHSSNLAVGALSQIDIVEKDDVGDNNENICYAFIRLGEGAFTEYEKSFFNCVVGVLSKSSAIASYFKNKYVETFNRRYSNNKYPMSTSQMENMLVSVDNEKARMKRLKDAITYSNKMWASSFQSWTDLLPTAELGARHILGNLKNNNVSVDSFAWTPNRPMSDNRGAGGWDDKEFGFDSMDSVARKVYSSGKALRSGNLLWIPLKIHSGDSVCVLCCERKFNLHKHNMLDANHSQVSKNEEHNAMPDVDIEVTNFSNMENDKENGYKELFFNDTDEEVMTIFCSLGTGAVDRLISHKETLASVQQASKAIVTLQSKLSKVESNMTMEMSRKMKFEEAMHFGCEIMSSVIRGR